MFAIYDNGNMIYRNSAENISKYNSIKAPHEANLHPDDELPYDDYINKEQKSEKQALARYKKMANIDTSEPIYHVRDIMSKTPITIHDNASFFEAYEKLKEYKVGQIPVINESNHIIGMINNEIILEQLEHTQQSITSLQNRSLKQQNFDEIITTDPLSDIRRVAQIMIQFKINTFPVVEDNGVLVGIVSKTDIIKAVSHIPHFQLWS